MRIYKIRQIDTGYTFWSVYPADIIPNPNEVIVQVDEIHDFASARRFAAELITMVEMFEDSESESESETIEDYDDYYDGMYEEE